MLNGVGVRNKTSYTLSHLFVIENLKYVRCHWVRFQVPDLRIYCEGTNRDRIRQESNQSTNQFLRLRPPMISTRFLAINVVFKLHSVNSRHTGYSTLSTPQTPRTPPQRIHLFQCHYPMPLIRSYFPRRHHVLEIHRSQQMQCTPIIPDRSVHRLVGK